MSWKKWLGGIGLTMLLVLLPAITALAGASANQDSQIRQRLADAQKLNQECLKCHDQHASANGSGAYVDAAEFIKSVHATLACTACHEDIRANVKHGKSGARELAKKVDLSCRKCHMDVAGVYDQSSHGKLFLAGKETALCSDCHGNHNIRKANDPKSWVYPLNSPKTCGKCHDPMYEKTYAESFHGRAVSLGSLTAATCVSCHGSHNILGPSDPKSTVNKANIPQTCAKCHLQARGNFAKGTEHAELKSQGPGASTYWTLKFFTWLTISVVTLLLIHMEMELWRRYHDIGKH